MFIDLCRSYDNNSIFSKGNLKFSTHFLISNFSTVTVNIGNMQQQILTELEAPNKFQHKEIKELIALSSTDDEIDVLTTIIRKYNL